MSSTVGSTRVSRFLGWGATACLFACVCAPGALQSQRRESFAAPLWSTAAISARRTPATPALRGRRPAKRTPAKSPAIVFQKVVVVGIPMNVVQVDPRRPEVRIAVATAGNGIGFRDPWPAIIDRTRPAAAITGTYFCPQSGLPVGSIVVAGRMVHRGLVGTAFAYTHERGAALVACRPGTAADWSRYETVLRAGPRLLTAGRVTLWPRAEGFRDPALFAHKRRTAVAITRHGKLLLVAVTKPVLLRTLARALRELGAVDAMCLDGGTSTGLYYRGKTRVKPGRSLTNLLVVYDSAARYQQQARRLVPSGPQVVESPAGRLRG
jgi:Phosphodiester glycosidase